MADTAGQAVSFGHTKKTTKQNNKNPDSCLRDMKNLVGQNANNFFYNVYQIKIKTNHSIL